MFVQSKEDSLVPYWQTEEMKENVLASKGVELVVDEMRFGGDHNAL